MIEWIFWMVAILWMVEAFASAVNAGWFVRWTRQQDAKWSGVGPGDQRQVALVVPAKGVEPENTPRFFDSIFNQDYRRYRLLIAVESGDDPVVSFLTDQYGITPDSAGDLPECGSGLTEVRLVVAGPCEARGQKVHNQLAAFEFLRPEDEIIAFADADILCGPDWLARLVAPINAGTHPLSTTYRWLIPVSATAANLFASVINASVATAGREAWSVLWGGSMAIARSDFDDLDVPGLLAGSLNDDLRLNKVARRSGRGVAFVRSLIMPSPVDHSWRSFFEFGCRQYYQVRHFSPVIHKCALLLTWVYTLGFLGSVAMVVAGREAAWIPIVFVLICDQGRAVFRRRIYRHLFGEKFAGALDRTALLEHLATPAWMMFHCLLATRAFFMRRIRWAGIDYRVIAVDRTEVLGRVEKT